MGQSASAYLAYGFDLGEDCPEGVLGNDSIDGVRILGHGYDYSGCFVALSKAVYIGDWNDPVKIDFAKRPSIMDEDIQKLKNFCTEYGVTYKEPDWYLLAHLS
jgi:hypothetical protein